MRLTSRLQAHKTLKGTWRVSGSPFIFLYFLKFYLIAFMLKRCKSIWPYYRPSENGEGKKKAIHHSNILLEPALSITIYIFLSTCNCSVQKRLFPFIFSFKLSKTDEVTETPDPTTTYNPPFIVFVFLLTKNTLLDFFYFSPEAASIGVVDRVFGNMIAWV